MAQKKLACELSVPERKALIETDGEELPVSTQAELPGPNRSGLYCKPVGPDEEDLKIKRMIDELYTAHPEFAYGSTKRKNWESITKPSVGI